MLFQIAKRGIDRHIEMGAESRHEQTPPQEIRNLTTASQLPMPLNSKLDADSYSRESCRSEETNSMQMLINATPKQSMQEEN